MSNEHLGRGSPRRFRIVGPIVAVVILAAAGGGWLVMNKKGDVAAKEEDPARKATVMELSTADVATVALATLNRGLPVTGSLSPLNQTTVKAQVAGEVLEVTVREGQAVRRGDTLVRIDTRNLKAELEAAQAALEKARADLALAKLNRDNSASLLEKKFISQNAYDTAESAWQVQVANVKAAEAQVSLAKIALGYATVTAPFDGTISARMVHPGQKVENGSDLFNLVDLGHLELQAPAPAYEIPSVRVGQIARFRVDGFGGRLFEGTVERINPMTDTGSRSIMLYLSVDNPENVLKGGMFAQGTLILDQSGAVPTVPITAVHSEAGDPYVLAIEDGRAVRRRVELGIRSEEQNLVEVRSGVKAGERVVSVHIPQLVDGTPVSPPASTAASAASAADSTGLPEPG